jgi:MacB-like periplasmic core domain
MTPVPNFFRRRKIYDDLSEEIRLHMEERVEQLISSGVSPAEAKRQAHVAFGNPTVFEERGREVWQWHTLESMWADLRLALRQLRRSPSFTIAAVITLALAIGANAVVFGVLNALILRPLNVPHPQSLYTIERGGYKDQATSYPDYLDLRDRNRTFNGLAAYIMASVGLDSGRNPTEAWCYEVSGNYFDAMDVQPFLGRFFHVADEHGPNSAPYLVLSYAYWHSHFQDDRGIVGRVVQVNKHPFTILGVAPREFNGTLLFFFPDFWTPMVQQEQIQGLNVLNARKDRYIFMVLGHLKLGVTPAQAIADLNSVGSYLEKTYPKVDAYMTYSLARPSLAGDMIGPR